MSEPGQTPVDDERRPGRTALGALAAVAVMAVAAGALHVLGVGGYRAGELVVAVILAGAGAATLLLVAREPSTARTVIAVAIVVVGFVAGSMIAARAPLSAGRLVDRLDDVELESFETLETERRGHSWCRPRCPVVERTYRAPNIAPHAAVVLVIVALSQADLAPDPGPLADRAARGPVAVLGPEHHLLVEGRRIDDDEVRVVVRLSARRR